MNAAVILPEILAQSYQLEFIHKTSNSWDFRECLCWSHKRKKGKEEERNQSMFPKSQKENMPQIPGHGFSSDLYLISSRIQFFIPFPIWDQRQFYATI